MKKNSESMPNLTQKIDFTETEHPLDEVPYEDNVDDITSVSEFNHEDFLPLMQEDGDESVTKQQTERDTSNPEPKSRFLKTKLMLFFFCTLIFAESSFFVAELIADFDVLDAAWLGFFAFILGSFFSTGLSEYLSLKRFRKAEDARRQSHYFLNSNAIGSANTFCQTLCLPLEKDYKTEIEKWQSTVLSHHTNKETVALFDDIVIAQADKRAITVVRKQAAATAALIGVSPLASVDMMIVFVRHWQMINQVSQTYGLRLGYGARIRLLKSIVKHMVYAGSSEILLEASAYALGSSLTAKLSTKVAQGLGAGALTGRLGLQVIAQCRPMEWKNAKKPTLTSITRQVLSDLRDL